ncbi:MAG: ribonuclease [Conexibacter sp.]|nr:ribonuclease [Conexibacter sp.]
MRPGARLAAALDHGKRLRERMGALDVIDRSLAVGAQAFSALIPLLIFLAAAGARGGSFADTLVKTFGLRGAGAEAVRESFGTRHGDVTLTVVGVVLMLSSALAFARALQRIFERSWDLPRRGLRNTGWDVIWLAVFAGYWAAFPLLREELPGPLSVAFLLADSFVMWLITPYLLLARRISSKRLVPQAALTAVGMTLLSAAATLYGPRAISNSAAQFGAIGVAFALLTILWVAGFVLVFSAVAGAVLASPPGQAGPRA